MATEVKDNTNEIKALLDNAVKKISKADSTVLDGKK